MKSKRIIFPILIFAVLTAGALYYELRTIPPSYNNVTICRQLTKGTTQYTLRHRLGDPKNVTAEKISYWGEPAGDDISAQLNPTTGEVIALHCPETAPANW